MNDANLGMLTAQLAVEWWKYTDQLVGRAQPASEYVDARTGKTVDASLIVSDSAEAPDLLGPLIMILAEFASTPTQLAYIGTAVLEDAVWAMGSDAIDIFNSLDLPPATRTQILAGFDGISFGLGPI